MISKANKNGVKYQLLRDILVLKNKTLIYYFSKLIAYMKYSYNLRY